MSRAQQSARPSTLAATKSTAEPTDLQYVMDGFDPAALNWKSPDWTVLIFLAAMHAGCLLAPFYFTWEALIVACVLQFLTACIGITLGYHRYLAHRSFKLARPLQFFVYLCGVISGEGTPLRWSATHRLHHARSDHDGDPHSPKDGTLWSHILWLFVRREPKFDEVLYRRFVPDLVGDRMLWFFEKTFVLWLIACGTALLWLGGIPMLIWGMCVRMVVVYHGTWFVNSATHLWGYRNYETKDMSRNLWWVGLLAYGEGWHNNHHAFPALARAGHRWWEIDVTFWVIRLFQGLGLAWDVKDRIPQPEEKRRTEAAPVDAAEENLRHRMLDAAAPAVETIAKVKVAAGMLPTTAAAVAILPVVDAVASK